MTGWWRKGLRLIGEIDRLKITLGGFNRYLSNHLPL